MTKKSSVAARSDKVDTNNPIYAWRVKNNVTRKELETMITIPYVDIYNWECGLTVPSEDSYGKLVKIGVKKEVLESYAKKKIAARDNAKANNLAKLMDNPITKWRIKKNIRSRAVLAKKIRVSRQTLLNWETGRFLPAEPNLYRLANLMGKAAFTLHDELKVWKEELNLT